MAIGEAGAAKAEELYAGHEESVLYDDRAARPGEKFADFELMGIPYRVVVSDKTLAENAVEVTDRKTGESKIVKLADFAID